MAKLNDVLKNVFIKAGYKDNDPLIADLLSNDQLAAIDVNDDVSGAINTNLISMDGARNHPDIGQVYRKQTLDTVDKKIGAVLDALELDDDARNQFLGETNTYKRLDNLNGLIKLAKQNKAGADNKADKAEHQKVIDQLNAELKKVKEDAQAERENFQSSRKNDLRNFSLKGKIKNFKTILDGTNETAKFATCNTVINSLLDEYKAELNADENGELTLQTKTGDPVYNPKNNTVIKADEFLEMALAQNKLLKVAEPANTGKDNEGGNFTPPINQGQQAANTDKTAKAVSDFNTKVLEMMAAKAK